MTMERHAFVTGVLLFALLMAAVVLGENLLATMGLDWASLVARR